MIWRSVSFFYFLNFFYFFVSFFQICVCPSTKISALRIKSIGESGRREEAVGCFKARRSFRWKTGC